MGWGAAVAALAWLLGGAAQAADKELLDILLSNGAINQAQYDQLIEKEEVTAEDLREVIVTVDRKGIGARTSDGEFSMRINGRLHAQGSGHEGNSIASDATDGTEIRRARFNMQGTVFGDWFWQSEVDFADNEVSVKDFFLGYKGMDGGTFIVGHQKQPYSLAVEMSSNDIPFIERGVDTDLIIGIIDRAIGFRTDFSGDHWHVATGIYGDSVDPNDQGNEGWGSVLRMVWAPMINEENVVHIGMRGAFRDPENNSLQFRSETTHMSSLFTSDTGTLTGIDEVLLIGPEAAIAIGPFSAGFEYNHAFVNRSSATNLAFSSWHVEAAYTLTGETRASTYRMSSSEFKRLQPARNFGLENLGGGAWELAARYAAIDLDDGDVDGGRQGTFTLALNWYLNPLIRLMTEWSRIVDTSSPNEAAEDLNIFQSRVQFAF